MIWVKYLPLRLRFTEPTYRVFRCRLEGQRLLAGVPRSGAHKENEYLG